VNCVLDEKILPLGGRRYHAEEPQAAICLSEFVGAVRVCEPGTGCATGAHGGGGRGQETECYRDRDGRLFLARPLAGDVSSAVGVLVFIGVATCCMFKD
jgi:hypothetical protein